MEYKRFENTVIVRIDKGEEILEKLKEVSVKENISLAGINALGAVNDFTVGVFDTSKKNYKANEFKGDFEIVSLTGTVSTMDGEYYSHLHMSAADENANVFGGHLNRAVVSVTCEMVINVINGTVNRKYDEETGINLFEF